MNRNPVVHPVHVQALPEALQVPLVQIKFERVLGKRLMLKRKFDAVLPRFFGDGIRKTQPEEVLAHGLVVGLRAWVGVRFKAKLRAVGGPGDGMVGVEVRGGSRCGCFE